jgi:hypothetical protein
LCNRLRCHAENGNDVNQAKTYGFGVYHGSLL